MMFVSSNGNPLSSSSGLFGGTSFSSETRTNPVRLDPDPPPSAELVEAVIKSRGAPAQRRSSLGVRLRLHQWIGDGTADASLVNGRQEKPQLTAEEVPMFERALALVGDLLENRRPVTAEAVEVFVHSLHRISKAVPTFGVPAAQLTQAVLEKGGTLRAATIRSSVALLGKAPELRSHLPLYRDLALSLITVSQNTEFAPGRERTGRVVDVVLALLGSPELLNSRRDNPKSTRNLGEHRLLDLGERLRLAADVGFAAVAADVDLASPRTEGRINLLVRGLATGAAALTGAALCALDPGNRRLRHLVDRRVREVESEYQHRLRYPLRREELVDAARFRTLSKELVSLGLLIVDESLRTQSWGGGVRQRYPIRGSTVNTLLESAYLTEMALTPARAKCLASVAEKALKEPEICQKLHSRALRRGVRLLVESGHPEGLWGACTVLEQAIGKGFGFPKEFVVAVHARASELTGVQFNEGWRALGRRMERWSAAAQQEARTGTDDITAEASLAGGESTVTVPRDRSGRPETGVKLKGGLGK